MIHHIQEVWYWYFWCHRWSNHQDQNVFWGNRNVEAVEASEVAVAAEVNEAVEVSKARKITTKVFRGILDLEFINLGTKMILFWRFDFWQNHENPFWILVPFLLEAVEASLCYFFENWLMKLKFPNLRNMQISSSKI